MLVSAIASRVVVVASLVARLLLGVAPPAWAHVELVASTPGDGAAVDAPLGAVTLTFSQAMEPTGDGVELRNAAGDVVPTMVSQPADDRIVLRPSRELDDGGYAVLWTVRAGDAHPRSGAVTFEVSSTVSAVGPRDAGGDSGATTSPVGDALAEVLRDAQGSTGLGSVLAVWLGRFARWISMVATLVAVGAMAFAATTLIGSRSEVLGVAYWIRRAGVLIAVGAVLDVAAQTMLLHGSLLAVLSPLAVVDTLSGASGVAVLLRFAGGMAVLSGVGLAARGVGSGPAQGDVATGLPASGPSGSATAVLDKADVAQTYRLDVAASPRALAGMAAAVVSYLFDGHTVTASPAWLVRVADVSHVVAASVWVGGVAMLSWVLARRRRRGEPVRAGLLAVRFSRVAAASLVVLAVAGTALSLAIVDDVGEFVTTSWGRVLLLKLAVVGVAAGLGGYNHRYVVPTLSRFADDAAAGHLLRRVVRVEAVVLLIVVAVTALLVVAAS